MKKTKSIILLLGIFYFSCSSDKENKPNVNNQNSEIGIQKVEIPYLNNENECLNFLKGKTFYGKIYRIEINNEGKVKVINKSDESIYFESDPGKQFELGEIKNEGRWASIRGYKMIKLAINPIPVQKSTNFEFVLLGDKTILMIDTGDKYTLVNTDTTTVEIDNGINSDSIIETTD